MIVCVIHQDHEAEEGWLVCRKAWGRLAGALHQIPRHCEEIESRNDPVDVNDRVSVLIPAGPTRPSWSQSRIRSSRPERLPFPVDRLDLLMPARAGSVGVRTRGEWSRIPDGDPDQTGRLSVSTVLDTWVRDWAETRGENLPRLRDGERSPVLILCSWLLDRLDWACQKHPALDEFAEDVRKLSSALYGLAGYGAARPKLMEAPCPACHLLTLTQCYEESNIDCENVDCRRSLTPDEYAGYVRALIEENR